MRSFRVWPCPHMCSPLFLWLHLLLHSLWFSFSTRRQFLPFCIWIKYYTISWYLGVPSSTFQNIPSMGTLKPEIFKISVTFWFVFNVVWFFTFLFHFLSLWWFWSLIFPWLGKPWYRIETRRISSVKWILMEDGMEEEEGLFFPSFLTYSVNWRCIMWWGYRRMCIVKLITRIK